MHSIFSFSRDFLPPSQASLSSCSLPFWYFLIRLKFLVTGAKTNEMRATNQTQRECVRTKGILTFNFHRKRYQTAHWTRYSDVMHLCTKKKSLLLTFPYSFWVKRNKTTFTIHKRICKFDPKKYVLDMKTHLGRKTGFWARCSLNSGVVESGFK